MQQRKSRSTFVEWISRAKRQYRRRQRLLNFESLELRRVMAVVSWDNEGFDNDWHNSKNWDTDTVPTSADDVTINFAGASPLITAPAFANSVLAVQKVTIDGGSLDLQADSQFYGGVDMFSGVLQSNFFIDLYSFSTLDGGLVGGLGTLRNFDTVDITSHSVALDIDVLNSANLNLAIGGNPMVIDQLTNGGNVNVRSGTLGLTGGETHDGSFSMASGAVIEFSTGTTIFRDGTAFVGNGQAHFLEGLFEFSGFISAEHVKILDSLSEIYLYEFASLQILDTSIWQAGMVSGPGTLDVTSNGTLLITGNEPKVLGAQTTLLSEGYIVQDGGNLVLTSNGLQAATVVNTNGGVYEFAGDASIARGDNLGPVPVIYSDGTFQKTAGSFSYIGGEFRNLANFAVVNVQSGELEIRGSNSSGGHFIVSEDAVLDLAGPTTHGIYEGYYSSSGNGNIVLEQNGAISFGSGAEFDFDLGMFLWKSGEFAGGSLTNHGFIKLTGSAQKRLGPTAALHNNGFVFHGGSGDLQLQSDNASSAALLLNHNDYSFEDNGDIRVVSGMVPVPQILNRGAMIKAGGTLSFIEGDFVNDGSAGLAGAVIIVETGELELRSSGLSSGGDFRVAAGAKLDLTGGGHRMYSGSYTGTGAGRVVVEDGSIDFTSATNFNFPQNLFEWRAGSFASGELSNYGYIVLKGNQHKVLGSTASLYNHATIIHADNGDLQLTTNPGVSSSTLYNAGPALYEITGDGSIRAVSDATPAPGFLNQGMLKKSGGLFSFVSGGFGNQSGIISVLSGELELRSTAESSGGHFEVSQDAILDLTGGGVSSYYGLYTGSGDGHVVLADGEIVFPFSTTFDFPRGLFQWRGGTIGDGALTNVGFMQLVGTDHKDLGHRQILNNYGTIVHGGTGNLQLHSDSTSASSLSNHYGGTYTFRDDGSIDWMEDGTALPKFINFGLLEKTGGTFSFIEGGFENYVGRIYVQAGELELRSKAASFGGEFDVDAGATLDLTGGGLRKYTGYYFGDGGGTVLLEAGGLDFDDQAVTFEFPAPMFQWRGGTIANGALINQDYLEIAGTISKVIASDAFLYNYGTIVQSGIGDVFLEDDGVQAAYIENTSSGFYEIQGGNLNRAGALSLKPRLMNSGLLRKTSESEVTANVHLFNSGSVQTLGGILNFPLEVNEYDSIGQSLWGGTWIVENATLAFPAGNNVLQSYANIELRGPTSVFEKINSLQYNSGLFSLVERDFQTAGDFTSYGYLSVTDSTLDLGSHIYDGHSGTNIDGTLIANKARIHFSPLTGTGTVQAEVISEGTIAPGAAEFPTTPGGSGASSSGPGRLTIVGNYTQTPNGFLNIDLAGTTAGTQYDQLAVTGQTTLDIAGLIVFLDEGYSPVLGDQYEVLVSDSVVNEFGFFGEMILPNGLELYPQYADGVTLDVKPTAVDPGFGFTVGGSSGDSALKVASDGEGNYYVTGYHSTSFDFHPDTSVPSPTTEGTAAFVAKYSPYGELLWARNARPQTPDDHSYGFDLTLDSDGNVQVVGRFSGTVDFDPSAATDERTAPEIDDGFIWTLTANGAYVRTIQLQNSSSAEFTEVTAITSDDSNIYITGFFTGTMFFGPDVLESNGGSDIFIAKLTNTGVVEWAQQIGGIGFEYAYAIDAKQSEGISFLAVGGYFSESVEFAPGITATSFDLTDTFILQLDSTGDFDSLFTRGSGGDDGINDLEFDGSGNVIAIGEMDWGGISIQAVRIKQDGDLDWHRQYYSSGNERGLAVAVDSNDNYYLGGAFFGQIQFDPDGVDDFLNSGPQQAGFIAKFANDGALLYSRALPSTDTAIVNSIVAPESDRAVIVGEYSGSIDIDLDPTADSSFAGVDNLDMFVLQAASLTVTGNGDTGPGTLEQAIIDSNAMPGRQAIRFNVEDPTQPIVPLLPLPVITDSLYLDATTQPGGATIVLDGSELSGLVGVGGSSFGTGEPGLVVDTVNGGGIRGLFIQSYSGDAIRLIASESMQIVDNTIVANSGAGISLQNANDVVVQRNLIGITGGGAPEGNAVGIEILGGGINFIGGIVDANRNRIAYNGKGIIADATGAQSNLLRNSFHSNFGLAIDILDDGVTLNDDNDVDGILNFPVIDSVTVTPLALHVAGYARPGTSIDLYLSSDDFSGFGEGITYLATVHEGSATDLDDDVLGYGPEPVNGTNVGEDSTASRFRFKLPLPTGVSAASIFTAVGVGSFSEFGPTIGVDGTLPSNLDIAITEQIIDEGQSVTLSGTFLDSGPSGAYTVDIDWGDGSPNTVLNLPAGTLVIPNTDHIYGDDDPSITNSDIYPISVQVSTLAGNINAYTSITVNNVVPSNLNVVLAADTIFEGQTADILLSFDDPGTGDIHRVTVNWGDGSGDYDIMISPGERTLSMSYTYQDNTPTSPYPIEISLRDDDGGIISTIGAQISVANATPSVLIIDAPAAPKEGDLISLNSLVTDPGALDTFTYTWTVTKDGALFASGSNSSVSFTPDDEGEYDVSLDVKDDDGAVGSHTLSLSVVNAPPQFGLAQVKDLDHIEIFDVNEGGSVLLSIGIVDPGLLDSHEILINWGDGSPEEHFSLPAGVLQLPDIPHTYEDDNHLDDIYQIVIEIEDDSGDSDFLPTNINIHNVDPIVTIVDDGSNAGTVSLFADVVDVTGDVITYLWTITGADITGIDKTQATITFPRPTTGFVQAQVAVTDDDGGTGSAAVVFVGGTDAADTITIEPSADPDDPGAVNVTLTTGAGTSTGTFQTGGSILIVSGNSPDSIVVSPTVSTPIVVDAGEGDDSISGGSGNDTIDGGEGADELVGGDGDDVLFALAGDDTIYGGAGFNTEFLVPGSDKTVIDGGGIDTLNFSKVTRPNSDDPGITFDLSFGSGLAQTVDAAGNTVTRIGTFENVVGTNYSDSITGNAEDNVLAGGDGDDTITTGGGGGKDSIDGGDGDDLVFGGVGNGESITGGGGRDSIQGGRGNGGFIFGGDDDDTVEAGDGDDQTIDLGVGDDFVFGGTGNGESISGGSGRDSIRGGSGNGGFIFGGDDPDTIEAGSGDNQEIDLGLGDDFVFGGTGNGESIRGGGGRDSIQGGSGNGGFIFGGDDPDTIEAGSGDNQTIDLGTGDDLVFGGTGNGESIGGGSGRDSIRGGSGNGGFIFGGDDDDLIQSGDGTNQFIDGGIGDDVVFGGTGNGESISGGSGRDSIRGGAGNGGFIFGGADNDTVRAGIGPNVTIVGGEGNDFIFGGVSNDSVPGSAGNRTSISGGTGNDFIFGGVGNSESISGGAGKDSIRGGAGNGGFIFGDGDEDDIEGGSGDNQAIDAGSGDDIVFGGTGNGESISGGTGRDSIRGGAGNGGFIFGGADNDTIRGGSGRPSSISGGIGNDFIFGGTGNSESISGGTGRDSIRGGAGNGGFIFGDEDDDTIEAGTGDDASIEGGDGDDFMFGGTGNGESIGGGTGRDSIRGGAGNGGFIFGGADNDTIRGGAGQNPTLLGGEGNDYIFGGSSNDSVPGTAGNGASIHGGVGNDFIFGGLGNGESISGGSGRDSITGGRGNGGFIYGGADEDSIQSGAGLSSVYGGTADDAGSGFIDWVIKESGGNITLFNGELISGDDITSLFDIDRAQLVGDDGDNNFDATAFSGDVVLVGRGGNDQLSGGTANDIIDGGPGNDSMNGGAGNDIYQFASDAGGNDYVSDEGSSSGDGVDFSNFAGPVRVNLGSTGSQSVSEKLSLTFAGNQVENAFGTAFSDVLVGSSADNKIFGGGGGDSVFGGEGNDVLRAGGLQLIYLDFDSATTADTEHVYTASERDAIQARIQEDFALFEIKVTQELPADSPFIRILFNETPIINGRPQPGGESERVGWRQLSQAGGVIVDVNGFLGDGRLPATSENFVALSATIGAHEAGHMLGIRHHDAFGPIGSGVFSGFLTSRLRPTYFGPSMADATPLHLISSPASVRTSLIAALGNPYLGEREAIKLAFNETGTTVAEATAELKTGVVTVAETSYSAQLLGQLPALTVPNTNPEQLGGELNVSAINITGVIDLVQIGDSAARSESDFYAFEALGGDILTIEVMSQVLRHRIGNPIDSLLRLYDATGNKVGYYGAETNAFSDDTLEGTDSILIDVRIPSDGTYFVEVDTFQFFSPEFPQYLPSVDVARFCNENATNAGCLDQDSGNYELFIYRLRDGLGSVSGDTILGGPGQDVIYGNSGRETLGTDTADSFFDTSGTAFYISTSLPDPQLDTVSVAPGSINENDSVTVTGTFHDPNAVDGHIVTVYWGDGGSSEAIITPQADGFSFQATHQYLDDGLTAANSDIYNLSVVLKHGDISDSDNSLTVEVRNVAPQLTGIAATYDVTPGQQFHLTAQVTDAGSLDSQIVTVNWGDETTSSVTIDPATGQIEATHSYARIGVYSIVLRASDDDSGVTEVLTTAMASGVELVAGALRIVGTSSSDTLTLVRFDTRLATLSASFVATPMQLRIGSITRVMVSLGNGDDSASIDATLKLHSIITGGDGNDSIQAGLGNDSIDGGDGNDVVGGGGGLDSLLGGDGDDQITGGAGNDLLLGGIGNDYFNTNEGNDLAFGELGNDTLIGGGGHDVLEGDDGSDHVFGDMGNDTIRGGEGDDQLSGGGGNDLVLGGIGNDIIQGDANNDQLFGEDGNDSVSGGDGQDNLSGADGNDQLFGDNGVDTVDGGQGNDVLAGGAGNDVLKGGIGNDLLLGDAHNDQLFGEQGNDTAYGGLGNDILEGADGDDALYGDAGNDVLRGGIGNDLIQGDVGLDLLFGQEGNDTVAGGRDSDVLVGDSGNDRLLGEHGRDILIGGMDVDYLDGGTEDDLLVASQTTHDQNDAALTAIMAEWRSSRTYPVRVKNIRNGTGSDPRSNGTFFLFVGTTVTDDGGNDTLVGGLGREWLFANLDEDQLVGRTLDEEIDAL